MSLLFKDRNRKINIKREGAVSKKQALKHSLPAVAVLQFYLKRSRGCCCTHKNGFIKSLSQFILLIKATPQ